MHIETISAFQASACTYLVLSHWPKQVTWPSQSQTERALQSGMAEDGKELELFWLLIYDSGFPFLPHLISTPKSKIPAVYGNRIMILKSFLLLILKPLVSSAIIEA